MVARAGTKPERKCLNTFHCKILTFLNQSFNPFRTGNQTWGELIVNANALIMHSFFPVIQGND